MAELHAHGLFGEGPLERRGRLRRGRRSHGGRREGHDERAHACHDSRGGNMGATSDDLMDIARAGAERLDMPDDRVRYPSFGDIEEQCATEYDELLNLLHDDELFEPVD